MGTPALPARRYLLVQLKLPTDTWHYRPSPAPSCPTTVSAEGVFKLELADEADGRCFPRGVTRWVIVPASCGIPARGGRGRALPARRYLLVQLKLPTDTWHYRPSASALPARWCRHRWIGYLAGILGIAGCWCYPLGQGIMHHQVDPCTPCYRNPTQACQPNAAPKSTTGTLGSRSVSWHVTPILKASGNRRRVN